MTNPLNFEMFCLPHNSDELVEVPSVNIQKQGWFYKSSEKENIQGKIIRELSVVGSLATGRPTGAVVIPILGTEKSNKPHLVRTLIPNYEFCQKWNDVEVHATTQPVHRDQVDFQVPIEFVVAPSFSGAKVLGCELISYIENYKANSVHFQGYSGSFSKWYSLNRSPLEKILEQYPEIKYRPTVYPNVVLFVMSATESVYDLDFFAGLEVIQESGLFDVTRPNLIISVTDVLSLSTNDNEIIKKLQDLNEQIQHVACDKLEVSHVPVVPFQNFAMQKKQGKSARNRLNTIMATLEDGFQDLPSAIHGITTGNKDKLGALVTSLYLRK